MKTQREVRALLAEPPPEVVPAPVISLGRQPKSTSDDAAGDFGLQWGRMVAVALAVVLVVMTIAMLVWPPVGVEARPIESEDGAPGVEVLAAWMTILYDRMDMTI